MQCIPYYVHIYYVVCFNIIISLLVNFEKPTTKPGIARFIITYRCSVYCILHCLYPVLYSTLDYLYPVLYCALHYLYSVLYCTLHCDRKLGNMLHCKIKKFVLYKVFLSGLARKAVEWRYRDVSEREEGGGGIF